MSGIRRCAPLLALALAAADAAPAQVSGVVVDVGLRPMAGALVSLRAAGVRTTTDADGRFAFPDATGTGLVVVAARKGYFNASATVAAPAAGMRLMLFAVPQTDDPRYALLDPEMCGACHPDQLLGAPDATSRYTLCVFDREGGSARLATRLDVSPGAGWRRMRSSGWMYADPTGSGDGVRSLRLKPDDEGDAWISLEAKGATLPLPPPLDGARFFAMDPAVTVELVNVETDRCWRADFDRHGTRYNDGARYKASQVPGP